MVIVVASDTKPERVALDATAGDRVGANDRFFTVDG